MEERTARIQSLQANISAMREKLVAPRLSLMGTLVRIVGLRLEVVGCEAPVGATCRIRNASKGYVEAEVVGFNDDRLLLVAEGNLEGLVPGAQVQVLDERHYIEVGEALIGRVIDGSGRLLDQGPALTALDKYPLYPDKINPLVRKPVSEPLDVGIRSINALLTLGRGQRVGLFAGSGVGKTTLMGMMTKHTEADIVVVALIGERGKEVRDFIEGTLGEQGMERAIVIASPADESSLHRLRGAWLATAIAEYFRDKGMNVLLLMDSLTRFAQAQREIGLAVGEPPVTRGYPPSVFSMLPKLIERAGTGGNKAGSITAVYTILTEVDAQLDPLADAARAILDGHLVLSREMAEAGIFPALDIDASLSRTMNQIVPASQQQMALKFKQVYSDYRNNRELIAIGAYREGSDPRIDLARHSIADLQAFIAQDWRHAQNYVSSMELLQQLDCKLNVTEESLGKDTEPTTQDYSENPESGVAA